MIIQNFKKVPKIAWNVPQYNVPGIQLFTWNIGTGTVCTKMPCIEFSATTMKNALCLGCILNLPCSRKLERHFYDLFLDAFSLTEWLQVACGSVCIDLVTVSSSLSGSNSLSKTEGGTCFDITDLDWQVHANWPSVHITISNHGLRWVWMKWDSLPLCCTLVLIR